MRRPYRRVRPRRLGWSTLTALLAGSLCTTVPGVLGAAPARATTGDVVYETSFDTPCPASPMAPGGAGLGIAFDGSSLWYSCISPPGSLPDLYRADPLTGAVTGSYRIAGGLGSLAYDNVHGGLWAGWDYASVSGDVRFIPLTPALPVTLPVRVPRDPIMNQVAVKFRATVHNATGVLDDGIAYDAADDSIYVSEDQSTVIDRYQYGGTFPLVASVPYLDGPCGNSGIAVGADVFYEGADGCNTVFTRNRVGNSSANPASFSTYIAADPTHRDEGLACDPVTFAPKDVLWSMEAAEPRRAVAFEIPAGSCGLGGQSAGGGEVVPPGGRADAYVLDATLRAGTTIAQVRTLADARTSVGTATNTVQHLVLPSGLGEVYAGGTDTATVDTPFAGTASASAQLGSFTLTLPTSPPVTISGSAVSARARIGSSGGAAGPFSADPSGGSIGSLLVDGIPVLVGQPAGPVVIPLPGSLGSITLFEQLTGGDGTTSLELEVNAVHVVARLSTGVVDVVLGSAYAGVSAGGPLTPRRPNNPLLYEQI
ncbi:MAG: hypothetical protein QOC82_829 [Frankiaceae bacterium]|jgi:hypothetical protein|nr:hypothetical protein [Frankiaceae bacterium]